MSLYLRSELLLTVIFCKLRIHTVGPLFIGFFFFSVSFIDHACLVCINMITNATFAKKKEEYTINIAKCYFIKAGLNYFLLEIIFLNLNK